jgi:ADP-ribose pyrophosphatase YjhB (NUDIX family)
MRTFGERQVYDGPELRLSQLDVELPDSERIWWDVVHLFRSASAVVIDGDDKVLLVRRNRFVQGRWSWELPGGLVDEDEEPREAVMRELEDQAGCRVGELEELLSFEPEPRSVNGEHTLFLGRNAERIGGEDTTWDVGRVEWIPLASVPELIAAGEIWAGATLVGLLKFLAER